MGAMAPALTGWQVDGLDLGAGDHAQGAAEVDKLAWGAGIAL